MFSRAGLIRCLLEVSRPHTPLVKGLRRTATLVQANNRGYKGHMNIRISHSGSKAQYKGDTRNHGL